MTAAKYLLPKTIKPFLAWLDTLPDRRKLYPISPTECPLAQFLESRAPAGTHVAVGGYHYDVGKQLDRKFPTWATGVFVVASDLSHGKWPRYVTAKKLREALRKP